MIIEDISPNIFKEKIQGKEIFLFGAGRTAAHCADIYFDTENIHAIVDNNPSLWNKYVIIQEQKIPVISSEQFVQEVSCYDADRIVLLITPGFYAWKIVEQLNQIEKLDNIRCYLHVLLRNNGDDQQDFEFSEGEQKIPKIIHYFWFGKKEIPQNIQKYIKSWRRHCKDYQIIRWDESNYDINKIPYIREAYANGAWGFVSDYARLDILYQYGGIYLDTDVEILKKFDPLLNDEAFFGMGANDQINTGSGFGAIPNHPFIKNLRDYYQNQSFYKEDGELNVLPCYNYQHPIFRDFGFQIKNEYQKRNQIVVYPAQVLSPTGVAGMGKFYSDKTVSIHHTELSWIKDEERQALNEMKIRLKEKGLFKVQYLSEEQK